jgi:hypothetical protein
MSSELSARRAYLLGRCGSGVVLLVGPVAATSAPGDRNPDVEQTDHSFDKRRHEPGGAWRDSAVVLASIPPKDEAICTSLG